MGWSVPQAAPCERPARWSPWVCVCIFAIAYFCALVWVVFDTPSTGLYSLASGHYLPLTGFTVVAILFGLTGYLLPLEIQSLMYFDWTHWQANTHAVWQKWTHQHLCIVEAKNFSPDAELLFRLAGLEPADHDVSAQETVGINIPTGGILVPGIFRFEALSRFLLMGMIPAMQGLSDHNILSLVVQTTRHLSEEHAQCLEKIWQSLPLTSQLDLHLLPAELPFEGWNNPLINTQNPVLILAFHYREPDDKLPEIATSLLLSPARLLKPDTQKVSPQLFRAMPLNMNTLPEDLLELRDMTQQPAESLRLVWFSGLTDILRQKLNAVVHDLKLPLRQEAPMGGQLDFDKGCGGYGSLSGWLMLGAAADMIKRGQGSQWVLAAAEESAWAVVVGDQAPVQADYHSQLPRDVYPAGCLVASLLFNLVLFWSLGHAFPDWLFSFRGTITLILTLVVTMIGSAVGLRIILNRLLEPHFIRSAQQGS
ncbi:hypothetical protein J1786_23600 [Rahnella sp. L72c]|uniref:Uncharacterized protein n=2 Tax=Rahnella perminowiae TaxID=2816244 RepID=A0ABS6L7Y7_9GAMM|nr:hypothetical protein [Rahnella perminowiae]MBU9837776.1 hypothetical protein [Rahnella perminowiae]